MRIRKISFAVAALGIALSVTASAARAQMDELKDTTPEEPRRRKLCCIWRTT